MQIDKIQTRINGAWRESNLSHVKVDGVWKPVSAVYARVNGVWITKSSNPRIGDFVYSDKSFSSAYNSSKDCVGIVFLIDPANSAIPYRIVSLTDSVVPQSGNHQDILGNGILKYVSIWGKDELLPMMPSYDGESQALSDMYGMNNLLALAANSKILAYTPNWNNPDQYPAHNFCAFTKGQEIGSPLNGWWLPSLGELASLGDNIDLINGRITQAGGDAIKGLYLSSTQKGQYEAWAYAILPDGNAATEWYKADPAGVRAVTGFSL